MEPNNSHRISIEEAEVALGKLIDAEGASGGCGGPWRHELTPVVKYCGVSQSGCQPVLLVNPTWMRELVARDDLAVLADEMRTWFAIENEVSAISGRNRAGRRPAA
jgi:hypothetical protein